MLTKTALAAAVAAAGVLLATPQSASALPQANGAKQINTSNVEKAGYYHHHRGWRRGHYRRHGHHYGHRHYRRPGFGIYLGF
ncbi:MAG: hypothetical protein K8F92_00150 [Hyphomicrobium sp.]|nr:MAG: hypothetical protein F9K20_16105 [Hyphomicrobium sp.]MBZ0208055.1 hypothetical protein [Hyphomicrobium sp.]